VLVAPDSSGQGLGQGRVGVLDSLLGRLGELAPVLLHLLVAGLAFAETALFLDLLVPGEVGLVLAGAAARHGGTATLPGLIAAGSVGAVLGDSCSYVLGRLASGSRLGLRVSHELHRAERFFERRGGMAVFLGRWVGALRAVVPFVAGAAHMPYGRFFAWNVAASLGWVSTVVAVGWYFGDDVARTVDRLGAGLSLVVVVGLGVWFLRRRRERVRSARRP
jgi:membrane-associated protein